MFPELNGRLLLVTGAMGFVGRHLVRTLAEQTDASLRLLCRAPKVDELPAAARGRSELACGDLTDPASLAGICDGVEIVFHVAAAMPGQPGNALTLDGYRRVNIDGTLRLAMSAAKAGARRFVFVSSTAAMGTQTASLVDETTSCHPASPYEVTKRLAEEGLLELSRQTGLEVVIVRPCLIAGEGQKGGALLKFLRLCRKGRFPVFGGRLAVQKPLVDVEDVAAALIQAAIRGVPDSIYLVTSGERHTLGEMLTVAGALTGTRRPYLPIPLFVGRTATLVTTPLARLLGREPPLSAQRLNTLLADRALDIGKARRELAYAPRHRDLKGMLGRTYAWYGLTGQL